MTEPGATDRARRHTTRALLIAAALALALGASFGDTIRSGIGVATDWLFASEDDHEHEGALQYYTCGMHPWVILPKPGDCPICFMELTPLDPDKFSGEITIDPVITQNMGVRIAPVEQGPLTRTIRTVGTVGYDETGVRDVNTKVGGWLERLHVDYLGAPVEVGQPLFDLYSPQIYSAQEEYLAAHRRTGGQGSLLEAARTRLQFFDVSDEEIAELERRGTPNKAMTIDSPWRGLVVAKHANEGMNVTPGMQLYRIADLSKVWVMVTLYEYQLPWIGLGQEAVMTLPYIPGQEFRGRVLYVYPYLDERTREVQARVEFDNPGLLLKPGMFANIELRSTLARDRTLVPREAVIDTGERQVAFVSLGEGRFEPRDVQIGVEAEAGRIEILYGLKPGEMVVTSGQFLLDSEANIREGLAKMIRGDLASDQEAVVAVSGRSEVEALPAEADKALTALLQAYFAISDTLASDRHDGLAGPARTIAASVDALLEVRFEGHPHFWHEHDEAATVRGEALELVDVGDLEAARQGFADLSTALDRLVRATGVPPGYEDDVQGLHCPMYRDGQGGTVWLQKAGAVRNPYYGSSMLECFDERATLPRTGASGASTGEKSGTAAPVMGHPAAPAIDLPPAEVDRLVTAYLAVQELLARDTSEGTGPHLEAMAEAAKAIGEAAGEPVSEAVGQIVDGLAAGNGELKALRVRFKDISGGVIALVDMTPPGAGVADAIRVAYCPMVKASWLQRPLEVSNPYYGSEMLTCGSILRTLELRSSEGGAGR